MSETLDVEQAASRLGMSRAAVTRRVNAGEITATRVGNDIRIAAAEVERYRQSLMIAMAREDQDGIDDDLTNMPRELTTTEAARQLGVTRPTVMKWIKDGSLAAHMVGSHHRVLAKDVMEFVEERREEQLRAFERLREADEALGLDN
ncbi:helix-turn-helix domain-containing protein [Tsukamurella paurometabola]|uniref:DNA binding domain, excisionase family n=1 Tax=Tsukamurella paurometabola TaxID=2061 RepID=A0A3P8KU17_TSUPA|nr:helix-turn-helix domain-containing protein [Tsukamurella paurometabola]UEA83302.1 helix-turn-helix domain-containing protein [Tsukamurella paurometabola]VDR40407.1 DNA binding domain, excisionase family [Tsukamurella paurometabola]